MPRKTARAAGDAELLAALREHDRRGMLKHVLSFVDQVAGTLRTRPPRLPRGRPLVFLGMGGSAIAAEIACELLYSTVKIPVRVERSFLPPRWAGRNVVAVAVSYSGSTEETLAAFDLALEQGAAGCVITSGGPLLDRARENGVPSIILPAGLPPRAAIGFLLGASAVVMEGAGIPATRSLKRSIAPVGAKLASLRPESPPESNAALHVARRILRSRTVPVVYAARPLFAAARRWRNQMNENAKLLAYSMQFPESNHNDIVGMVEHPSGWRPLPVLLRWPGEPREVRERWEHAKRIAMPRALEVWAPMKDEAAALIYHILVGDLASVYAAVLRGKDPTPVNPIEDLKRLVKESRAPTAG